MIINEKREPSITLTTLLLFDGRSDMGRRSLFLDLRSFCVYLSKPSFEGDPDSLKPDLNTTTEFQIDE
jgi:hypothetical protein